MELARNPEWVAETLRSITARRRTGSARWRRFILVLRLFFIGAILAVLLARVVRRHWRKRQGVSRVTYPDGRFIDVSRGVSVLEASRLLGVPHASVCGGRGRCSTCRSRIEGAASAIPPPSAEEIKVAAPR